MNRVQIRSFFWSVFSHIRAEYGQILCISPYSVQMRENADQKKLRIWTVFTQWAFYRFLILSVTLTVNTWITSTSPLFEVASPLYFHLSSRNWLSEPWFGRKHVTCVKLPWSFFFSGISFSYTVVIRVIQSCVYRSSRLQMSFKICVLINFTIFNLKHLYWSLLIICKNSIVYRTPASGCFYV